METAFSYTDSETAYFSSDERKWIGRVRKLKEKHPDDIEIIAEPEDNDGCIYCKVPVKLFDLRYRGRNLSEEQRQASAERMRKLREVRNTDNNL